MPAKPTRVSMSSCFESKSGCWLDFEIEAMLYPAEPEVRYYPDGSGCPESPAEVEILEVKATYYGSADFTDGIERRDRPDWFELLDKIATKYVFGRESEYNEELTECNGW